jgi:hypothetical protein
MQDATSAAIVQKLEALIEEVEVHISEQCTHMLSSDDREQAEATLADMISTLEQLHAFRDRFYATVH